MADNEKNKNSGELEQETKYKEYRGEMDTAKNKSVKSSIKSAIEEIKRKIENEKISEFKKEYPEFANVSDDKIKDDPKFKEFNLSNEKLQDIFDSNKEKVISIIKKRQGTLHDLGGNRMSKDANKRLGKVENLLQETQKLKEEKENALKSLDKNKDKDEIAKINNEISRLDAVITGIGDRRTNGTILGDLAQAFDLNNEVREEAYNGLSNVFGKEIVEKDEDLKKVLLGNEIKKATQDVKDIENGEPSQAQEQGDQQKGQGGKGNPLNGAIPAAAAAKAMADGLENQGDQAQEVPDGMAYLNSLGYDGSVLNSKSSRQLLDAFVNADEKAQIGILGDKDAQKKIFEAMKKANNRWTPLSAIKFNKTRRALLEMANGSMMRKALETVGKDVDYTNLDQMGEKFNNVLKDYEVNRAKKQKEIDALPDGEEKSKLQSQLDEFDKEYGAISGVNEFRNISNKELNRFRDRVINKMSSLFDRSNMDRVSLPSKNEVIAQEHRDVQSDRGNGFRENMQRNVTTMEDRSTSDLKQELGQQEKGNVSKNILDKQKTNEDKER